MSDAWRAEAACLNMKKDLFLPRRGGPTDAPKAVCAVCPVAPECFQFSLDNGEKFGIWGGRSERERRVARVGLRKVGGVEGLTHGTPAAYRRHLRDGDSCTLCRQANAERRRLQKDRTAQKQRTS